MKRPNYEDFFSKKINSSFKLTGLANSWQLQKGDEPEHFVVVYKARGQCHSRRYCT